MSLHVQQGLAMIGFGLLVGFVGLVWVINLFGVADEHARRIATSRWAGRTRTALQVRDGIGFQVGRYLAGGGFVLFGVVIIIGGVARLIAAPIE